MVSRLFVPVADILGYTETDTIESMKPTQKSSAGFTLVEMMVVLTISMVISSLFLANYKQSQSGRNLKLAADSVVSATRLMQNNILSGLPHPAGNPTRDYSVRINQTQYFTYVDQTDPSGGITNRITLETINFPPNVSVTSITLGATSIAPGTGLEIRFFPPFGTIKLVNPSTSTEVADTTATVVFSYPGSSVTKTLTIDGISGRIQVQ
jgi:prepilin-type N-terminal cleavage/methylation domain-containing protein